MESILTKESLRFLESARVGHLSTADGKSRPHVVPVVFVIEHGKIYTPIDGKPKGDPQRLRRIRNILVNPQVGFLVDRYEEDWAKLAFVFIRGTASILSADPKDLEETARQEYRDSALRLCDKYPQYQSVSLGGPQGLMIRIIPEGCTTWGRL